MISPKAPHFLRPTALWLCLLLAYGSATAQSANWDAHLYYGIPEADKQSAFLEEFENNQQGWDLGNASLNERIERGYYYLGNLTSHAYPKYREVNIDLKGDYEVEARMRIVKGARQPASGLVFGHDVSGNEYSFLFNGKGLFSITKRFRGRDYALVDWTPYEGLSSRAFNTLTVRAVGGQWYFFINEKVVHESPAHQLFGQGFGFVIGGYKAVEVDYLRVSALEVIDREGPEITILEPALPLSRYLKLADRRQIISGKVHDPSGIQTVTINGQSITVSRDGIFSASLRLPDGRTDITVVAIDAQDNFSQEGFVLDYQEPAVEPVATLPTPVHTPFVPQATPPGRNYLLIIGVNEYVNWSRLHNAVKDCKDLATTLTTYYKFEPENVITLFNEDATRENILETLESLQDRIQPHDNLLIYYAGHGYYDQEADLGYWVPVNARLNKIPDFIRNSTIHDYLRTIRSKNTFLIADACYAGSLFSVSRGNLNENATSRWAFTSGNIEKVWDGQPGQNSPFARYLLRVLRNNTSSRLYANDLIDMVGDLVQSNTGQSPKGSPLRQVGDEGGIFVFERRQ
ncbi:MAG: caspase family protein [Bacteroidetes bacterium]|nr:MAG: caspase family protein [Bacteroidota bacterium]